MNRRNVLKAAGFATAAVALLFAVALPTVAKACAFCDTYRVVNVANWDMLNIRSGPSTKYKVVGVMPPDAEGVTIIGECDGKWCPVAYRDRSGWVNTNFLQPVN